MKKLLLFVGSVLSIGASLLLLWRAERPVRAPKAELAPSVVVAPRMKVAGSHEPVLSRVSEAEPEMVARNATPSARAERPGAPRDGRAVDAEMDRLFQAVRTEQRETIWARESEGKIRTKLAALPKFAVESVECGSMRCTVIAAGPLRTSTEAVKAVSHVSGLSRTRIRTTKDVATQTVKLRVVLARDGFNVYGEPRTETATAK